ncbi:hypothetical protein Pfo_016288 [Paulownia fortunei]|nr:hypothetical protein Pfo_016288 [Paulownia fortunei]
MVQILALHVGKACQASTIEGLDSCIRNFFRYQVHQLRRWNVPDAVSPGHAMTSFCHNICTFVPISSRQFAEKIRSIRLAPKKRIYAENPPIPRSFCLPPKPAPEREMKKKWKCGNKETLSTTYKKVHYNIKPRERKLQLRMAGTEGNNKMVEATTLENSIL